MSEKKKKTWIKWVIVTVVVLAAALAVLLYFNQQFTVSFVSDGGSGIPQQSVRRGTCAVEPDKPEREGYRFVGWTYNGSAYSFSRKIDRNMILIAKWEKIIKAQNIALDKDEYFVNVGESISFKLTFMPEDANEELDGYADDESIVAVDASKRSITGLKEGTTTFTISAQETFASAIINVLPVVESISLPDSKLSMAIGETYQIKPIVMPSNAYGEFIYSSSNNDSVTVSQSGLICAVEEGVSIITIKCGKNIKEQIEVTVRFSGEEKITINPNSIVLDITANPSEKLQVIYSCPKGTDKTLTFTSSDPSVATVDSEGLVSAKGRGVCEIIAESKNGHKAWTKVTVDYTALNITIDDAYFAVEVGKTFDVKTLLNFDPAASQDSYSFTFASSDESIATVDENGLVKGVRPSPNNAVITVTLRSLTETVVCYAYCYCNGEEIVINRPENFTYVSYNKVFSMSANTVQLKKYTKGLINSTDLTYNDNCTVMSDGGAIVKDSNRLKSAETCNEQKTLRCTFNYNGMQSGSFEIVYIPQLDITLSCEQDHTFTKTSENSYRLILDEQQGSFTVMSNNVVMFSNPSYDEGFTDFTVADMNEKVSYDFSDIASGSTTIKLSSRNAAQQQTLTLTIIHE